MKGIFRFFLSLAVCVGLMSVSSCNGGSSDSPVDKYVEIIDQATKKAEEINSISDISKIQSVISPAEAQELIKESADYELTDSDRKKLKKSTDKLIRVAFEKQMKFSGFSEEQKKNAEMQIDIAIEAANKYIDNAKTLGEISGVR